MKKLHYVLTFLLIVFSIYSFFSMRSLKSQQDADYHNLSKNQEITAGTMLEVICVVKGSINDRESNLEEIIKNC
jgi:hypothetical protein